jgi:hypothetical protein
MRHAFVLEMSIEPGFGRKDSQFLYGTLTEVQRAVDLDLWVDFAYYQGLLYHSPEQVELTGFSCTHRVWKKAWSINLRPYITVQGPGGLTFALDAEGRPVGGIDKGLWNGWEVGGVDVSGEAFITAARAWVDWSCVPIPDLPGQPLRRQETAWFAPEDFDENSIPGDIDPEKFGLWERKYGCVDYETGAVDEDFENAVADLVTFDPAWLAAAEGRVARIAASIHESRDFTCLGVLADALEEAGCDNPLFLWHCRLPPAAHARGSWVVEFLLEQAAGGKETGTR